MNILVLGAGAWGTALAVAAARVQGARGARVSLWARDPAQAQSLSGSRCNARYLPDIALGDDLAILAGPHWPTFDAFDLVLVATPVKGLRTALQGLAGVRAPVAWVCKGFESSTGALGHEVAAQVAPHLNCGVLSGPSFALEVARGQPTALVAASPHAMVRDALVQALHGPSLRVYGSDDVVGVEVGGAVKNVLAIATGLCDGMQLGLNARAALVTRGLAEMTRLGLALGARVETFMGLSGLGDLVLTATGDLSRNRQVGLALAQGRALADVLHDLGHVAEGVACARTVAQRAHDLQVDMPITEAVVALLDGRLQPKQAVALLMQREARDETF